MAAIGIGPFFSRATGTRYVNLGWLTKRFEHAPVEKSATVAPCASEFCVFGVDCWQQEDLTRRIRPIVSQIMAAAVNPTTHTALEAEKLSLRHGIGERHHYAEPVLIFVTMPQGGIARIFVFAEPALHFVDWQEAVEVDDQHRRFNHVRSETPDMGFAEHIKRLTILACSMLDSWVVNALVAPRAERRKSQFVANDNRMT